MVADVSSLSRMMRDYKKAGKGKAELITRDLLGGGGAVLGSAEVDLELRVPVGWERSLDLFSGRTYFRRNDRNPTPCRGRGLTIALPPPPPASLLPSTAAAPLRRVPTAQQSVCTLEKVRWALERAEREERPAPAALLSVRFPSSPSSSISTSASFKRRATDEEGIGLDSPTKRAAAPTTVGGCPACHLYVLVSAVDPRCPRCATRLQADSEPNKRPMFDLNSPVEGLN